MVDPGWPDPRKPGVCWAHGCETPIDTGVLCATHTQEMERQAKVRQVERLVHATGLPPRWQGWSWARTVDQTRVTDAEVLGTWHTRGDRVVLTRWNHQVSHELREVATGAPERSYTLLLTGGVGGGKTTLCAATLADLARHGVEAVYLSEAELHWALKSQFGLRTQHDVVGSLCSAPALFLDDLGTLEAPPPWHRDAVERLLCRRYDMRRQILLITTNLNLSRIAKRYGERVASRLVEMTKHCRHYVDLQGPDFRTGRMRGGK